MPSTKRYISPRKFFSGEIVEFTSTTKYAKHQFHLGIVKKIIIRRVPYYSTTYMVDCECGARLIPEAPQLSLVVAPLERPNIASVSNARNTYFLKQLGLDQKTDSVPIEDQVEDLLSRLTEREKDILTLRYGLDGSYNRTLQQIGDMQGVTRERIRQVESKAMHRLRTADAY